MRILNRYLTFDYLVIFLAALGLITFVMTVGALVKAVDLMARGISPALILQFFFQNVPYILSFSMPISTLFAALLLFGRLSMDSEISAMKACGLSLWRLVAPLVMLSILFSGICIYINCEVAPEAKYANRKLMQNAGVEEPINLLEEGRFINDFPGLMIYVGKKNGNLVKDVVAYELNDSGGIVRSVRAQNGELQPDNKNRTLSVQLYDVHIEIPSVDDPQDISKTTYVNAEHYPIVLDFEKMMKSGKVRRKRSHMKIRFLMKLVNYADYAKDLDSEGWESEKLRLFKKMQVLEERIEAGEADLSETLAMADAQRQVCLLALRTMRRDHEKAVDAGLLVEDDPRRMELHHLEATERAQLVVEIEKTKLMIEANRRLSIAIGCFTFMLIGIPLGVKSHRRETSVGMVMSLAIVFAYYMVIVLAKALADYPHLYPNLVLWVPMVALQILGIRLIRRSS